MTRKMMTRKMRRVFLYASKSKSFKCDFFLTYSNRDLRVGALKSSARSSTPSYRMPVKPPGLVSH